LAVAQEADAALVQLRDVIGEIRRLSPALARQAFLRHVLAMLPADKRAALPTPIVTGWDDAAARAREALAALSAATRKARQIVEATQGRDRQTRGVGQRSARTR
jgi:hypothetical protein